MENKSSLYPSLNDFINSYTKKKNLFYDKNGIEKREKDFYENTKITNINNYDTDLLNKIDGEELAKKSKYKFFNSDVMELMSYYTKLMIHISEDSNNEILPIIRDIFTNLQSTREDISNQTNIKAGFKSISDLFILKIPRNLNENLLHEFFIGNKLNILRDKVPNFSYIYGSFNCNYPIFFDQQPYNICSMSNSETSDRKVNYIIYENITDSISFKDFADNANIKEFMNVYIQILFALNYANEKLKFVHYNLHYDNIVVKTLPNFVKLAYPYKNKFIYIKTNKIPFIIDYGYSRLNFENFIYGIEGSDKNGTVFIDYNPFQDPFRLLTSTLDSTYFRNYDEGLYEVLKYFVDVNKEDGKYIIKNFDYLPDPPKNISLNLVDFIDYVIKLFSINIETEYKDTPEPLFSCPYPGICENKQEIIVDVTDTNNENSATSRSRLSMYNLYSEIKRGINKQEHIEIFNRNIPLIDKDLKELTNKIFEITNRTYTDITNIENINYLTLTIINNLKKDIISIYKINEYIELYKYKINMLIDILNHFLLLDPKNETIIKINNSLETSRKYIEQNIIYNLNFRKILMENNITHLKELSKDKKQHNDIFVREQIEKILKMNNIYTE